MTVRFTKANQESDGWPERREVKSWVLQMVRLNGGTRQQFCDRINCNTGWLSSITDPHSETTPPLVSLEAIAREMHDTLPTAVARAAERLAVMKARHQRGLTDLSPLGACKTAADEVRELLRRSVGKTQSELRERNLAIMERRLGIDREAPMTLEATAEPFGLTRERVRQIEAKLAKNLSLIGTQVSTPILDELAVALKANLGRSATSLDDQLRPMLGEMSCETVVAFIALLKGEGEAPALTMAVLTTGDRVLIVGGDEEARIARDIFIIAKRHQSFSGAVSIDNVRRALESQLGGLVSIEWLNSLIDSVASTEWLDDGKRWFCIDTDEPTSLVTQVAVVIALAGRPVAVDVIYSGIMKESRRERASSASEVASPLAPYEVVYSVIQRSPMFRRCSASRFELVAPFDPLPGMEGVRRQVAEWMLERGGVASLRELSTLAATNEVCSRAAIVLGMYLISWTDRIAPGVYAIRGIAVCPNRLKDAIDSAAIVERPPLIQGKWSMTLLASEYFLRSSILFPKRRDVPEGVEGLYTLPDGHQILLVDDKHGIRINRVGVLLRGALNAVGRRVRVDLDTGNMTAVLCQLEDEISVDQVSEEAEDEADEMGG